MLLCKNCSKKATHILSTRNMLPTSLCCYHFLCLTGDPCDCHKEKFEIPEECTLIEYIMINKIRKSNPFLHL